MNQTVILGAILAVFVMSSLMMSPAVAASVHEFSAIALSFTDEFKVRISATTDIPQDSNDASYGYGVITEEAFFDTILVTTTHGGFLESADQHNSDDARWHNHYLTLTDDGLDNECAGLEVADISYDSPGDVRIHGENIVFDGARTLESVNPFTGAENVFQSGETIVAIISFDIAPVFTDGEITNICIDVNGLHPIK
ncbi:hypothetical protein [Nitrosopumilus sp.]|uniref:hypothetical protein n=1 Tax=Nitrosopumilus sp. TaxID=2024843 RepID=UPI003D0FC22D